MPSTAPLTGTVHVDPRQVVVRAVLVGLLASALIAVPVLLHHRAELRRLHDSVADRERHLVELGTRIIVQTVQSVVSDLRYLAEQNELRELLATDTAPLRARLAEEYSAFLTQKPRYDQVRWIGPDGRERVRVDLEGGKAVITPPDQLQDKAHRYYFVETMQLPPRQIYVSPLDLNVERDQVEEPRKPTLRLALPLFDPSGQRAGILVVNFLAAGMLEELRALPPAGGSTLWLLNAEGYWLLGLGADEEWAFMYPGREDRSLAARDPDAWRRLALEPRGSVETGAGLLTFERVYPLLTAGRSASPADTLPVPVAAADYHWVVATRLPLVRLQDEATALRRSLLLAYLALAALAFAVASGLAFLSFRTRAVSRFVQHVMDHVPAMIAYVDANERYRYNNRCYETLLGLESRQLAGRPVRGVLGDAAYEVASPHIRAALAGDEVSFEAAMAYASVGHRDVSVTYVPDVAADGRVWGFIAIVNDVTPLKTAERRERQRLREIAHATRLASVGEMATQIAHEVNQPITALVTYCAAAQRHIQAELPENARLAGLISAISEEAQRVSQIIRRLRDFARRGEISFVAADVNEIVRDCLRLVAAETAAQHVQVVEELAPGPLQVMADPLLVSQATQNLLRNAIEAVATVPEDRRLIRVATQRKGRAVEVRITDSGPGLAPAVSERLFEAFITTKPSGLGMGLSIARTIIEAHGGQIHHSAAPSGGCIFTITLPGVDA